MNGITFLMINKKNLEALVPDIIDRKMIRSIVQEMKDAVDCIDMIFPKKSRDSKTVTGQDGLNGKVFPKKTLSQLHFPMPQFWDAELISEWLQDLEGGLFEKYIPKVKRLKLTGKQVLTD